MQHPTERITYTIAFLTPVVENWLEREIGQRVHHEGSIRRPRSYTSLRYGKEYRRSYTHVSLSNELHIAFFLSGVPNSTGHLRSISPSPKPIQPLCTTTTTNNNNNNNNVYVYPIINPSIYPPSILPLIN